MALAPGRVTYIVAISVYTLGSGVLDSLRSFATGLVGGRDEVENLYLGMGFATTLGGMVASALWSGVLSAVLGKGWVLERIPFWGVLGAMGVVFLVVKRLERYVPAMGMV